MARIKKFAGDIPQGLSSVDVFLIDDNPISDYFRISEFNDTFTGGKNGFLIEGTPYLKETTEVKIEILDVEGNTVYYEPGDGIPEYYEGISKVISVHVYEDTPIGIAKITILGELKQYLDTGGVLRDVPEEWKGLYNVKWERNFTINKNLTNEDKVRFYRRPDVAITEIARPIFTANPISITQTGNVLGTPLVPAPGTNITTFPRPSQYLLTTLDDTRWTGSIVNSTIDVDGQTLSPLEVVSETELVVSTPYTDNNIVVAFNNKSYSTTFNYIKNEEGLGTALSGSFGKFVITNLETFVGDVHRIKVFRTSQADLTDFQFVQEIVLESTEILIDYEQSQRDEESYGLFTPFILDEYWELSSVNITKEFNQSFLFNSVKLDSTGTNTFSTINNVPISNGIEYTLSFNTRIPEVVSGNEIEVYLQGTKDGTTITQSIGTVESSGTLLQKSAQEFNFIARDFDDSKLYFKVTGQDWYISTVSLRAAQETAFSPDEITFIQTVPRTLEQETFDFRFEFYDINNNYIPVNVTATKTFSAGNLNEINKSIEIVPTNLFFQFDSGSQQGNAIPPKSIFFNINKEFLTGSTTWTSGAYDNENNLIDPAPYALTSEEFYPGLLTDVSTPSVEKYRLTVESFSGSIYDTVVQYIEYTAECEGVSDNITITRMSDGKGGVNFDIRPFRGTVIRNSSPTSSVEIQAVRIDGLNEVNLRAGLPLDYSIPLLYVTSASLEGDISYITLEQASSSGYIIGLNAGKTGSGEINYNAEFNRDAIDGQQTIYLIPSTSPTSESILTSLTLTDLQDGLNTGEIIFTSDTFAVDAYPSFQNPSLARTFNPTVSKVTGSFFRRGQTTSPISGTLDIYPSMSINSDYNPQFWLYYETNSFNEDITFEVTDENQNTIQPQDPILAFDGSTRNQHKQVSVTFTYNEPFTTASVSVEKTFNISPDGKGGDDAIVIELDPRNVTLNADESRFVEDLSPTITSIRVKQGNDEQNGYLTYSETKEPGTFYINEDSVVSNNIAFEGFSSATDGLTEVITSEYNNMTDSPVIKKASVIFPIEIRPYFTSSYFTSSVSQSITRVDEGAGARGLTLRADTNTVTYNGDGNVVEPTGDITLTAEAFNTTGSGNINFFFYKDNSFIDLVNQNSTTVTKTIPSSEFPAGGTVQTYRVELHDGNDDINTSPNAIASTTITGIQDGTNNYQAVVTNQNATMFVDVYENKIMDNTSTTIEAYKGQTQLTHIGSGESYGFPTFDDLGNIIPNGNYRVSIHSFPSSYLDISGSLVSGSILPTDEDGNAFLGPLDDWTNFRNADGTPNSASAQIVFRVDFEDGRDSTLVRQNLSVGYEGNVGPGLIMRGEWTGDLDYIFDVPAKRRDAVFREISGDVHYWATTIDLADAGSPPYTYQPIYTGTEQAGDIDANGWQYLGVQDFFVAAKLAIFEESFVKNTINVGNNPGSAFANIVIAGGRTDPYIAVGQNGTVGVDTDQTSTGVIGYNRPGTFMGTYDDGLGNKTPRFSLVNTGTTRYLRWDSENLEIAAQNFSLDAAGNVSVTGAITVTGGNAATQDYADGAASSAGTSAQDYATTIANNIVNGSYGGGTFIDGSIVYSPTIAGTAGIFTGFVSAGNFRLGQNVFSTFDGLYINTNNYWFDDGNFSIGNGTGAGVTWNPGTSTLTIGGDVIIGGTAASILEDNAANAVSDGDTDLDLGISSGDVGGWTINSTNLQSNNLQTILYNTGIISLTDGTDEKVLITKDSIVSNTTTATFDFGALSTTSGTQNVVGSYTFTGGSAITNSFETSTVFTVTGTAIVLAVPYKGTTTYSGTNRWNFTTSIAAYFDNIRWDTGQYLTVELWEDGGVSAVAIDAGNVYFTTVTSNNLSDTSNTHYHDTIPDGVGAVVFSGLTAGDYYVKVKMSRTTTSVVTCTGGPSQTAQNFYLTNGSAAATSQTIDITTGEEKVSLGINGLVAASPGGFAQVGPVASVGGVDYSGAFLGDVKINGVLQVGSVSSTSDERLKVNIRDIDSPLLKISSLNPKSFTWKNIDSPFSKLGDAHGFIAQEVQTHLPELVEVVGNSKYFDNLLSLDYQSITAINTAAIKSLLSKIEELEERILELENK